LRTRLSWVDQAARLVFPATGRRELSRVAVIVSAPALFDKWFEERETQAAESWRIQEARKRFADRRDSGDLCVSAITMTYLVRGNPGKVRLMCEGARYAEIPWINLQAKTRIRTFNLRV